MKVIMFFLIATTFVYSQGIEKKNNIIYAEIFGNGLFASLNYERAISDNFTARVGLGYVFSNSESNSGSHHDFGFLPLAMLNYLIEIHGNNYFELGAGALLASSALTSNSNFESTNAIEPTFAIGYRYSPKAGGIFFSAAFDMFPAPGKIYSWGGLGIGIRF